MWKTARSRVDAMESGRNGMRPSMEGPRSVGSGGASWDNLLLAAERAEKGKRRRGNVARFNLNREWELLALQE